MLAENLDRFKLVSQLVRNGLASLTSFVFVFGFLNRGDLAGHLGGKLF